MSEHFINLEPSKEERILFPSGVRLQVNSHKIQPLGHRPDIIWDQTMIMFGYKNLSRRKQPPSVVIGTYDQHQEIVNSLVAHRHESPFFLIAIEAANA